MTKVMFALIALRRLCSRPYVECKANLPHLKGQLAPAVGPVRDRCVKRVPTNPGLPYLANGESAKAISGLGSNSDSLKVTYFTFKRAKVAVFYFSFGLFFKVVF
ncbi:hypothetical protein OUZ56_008791 [Daphnia magna]|uniref:Secreted protein n=1 Tax=Daphnia magna TaxID=35525 RepID=A0ABR0AE16_9CRUS|nr:hypothetical protein OUZ56_008791 [Daphnia magna]